MATEIKVPALGESVSEATIARWFKKPGEALRILWTYAAEEPKKADEEEGPTKIRWMAPQIARIELANFPSVYKIYALINETAMSRGEGTRTKPGEPLLYEHDGKPSSSTVDRKNMLRS